MRSLLIPAALVLGACATQAPARPAPAHDALPFIEDDYPRAVAEAKSRKLPLFVDAWAPW